MSKKTGVSKNVAFARGDRVVFLRKHSLAEYDIRAGFSLAFADYQRLWDGLDSLFEMGREIWVASDRNDVLRILQETEEDERRRRASNARQRVLAEHTAAHRAEQLEGYLMQAAPSNLGVELR